LEGRYDRLHVCFEAGPREADQDLFGTTISLTPSAEDVECQAHLTCQLDETQAVSVSWTQFDLNDRSRGRPQNAGVNATHGSVPRGYQLAAFKRLPSSVDWYAGNVN
jgi:hypothetical protein